MKIKHTEINQASGNINGLEWDETKVGTIYHCVGEDAETYWLRTEFDLVPFWFDGHQWDLLDAPHGACAEFQTDDADEGTSKAYEYTVSFITNAIN